MKPNYLPAFKRSALTSDKPTYQPYSGLDQTLLEFLCDQGDPGALTTLGEKYLNGDGLEENAEKAARLFRLSADKGDQDAMFLLACCYLNGTGVEKSYAEYFSLLEKSAEMGSWMAAKNMATAYFHGKDRYEGYGYDQDDAAALQWSIKAADQLVEYYDFYSGEGFDDFKSDAEELVDNYASMVEVIAKHYFMGRGADKSIRKSILWLEKGNQLVYRASGSTWSYFDARIEKLNAMRAEAKK